MNRVENLLLSFILLFPSVLSLDAQTLSGPLDVCSDECYSYDLTGADPTVTYYWTIDGGNPSVYIGNSLEICWIQNTGEISISDQGFNTPTNLINENLDILYSPLAEILDIDTGVCPTDSLGGNATEIPVQPCTKVCSGTSTTFQALDDSGNSFVWSAEGGNVLSSDENEIFIEWGAAGFGQIELTESNGICESSDFACVEILENPLVDFDTSPSPGTSGSIEICKGQEIYFSNTSTGASDYLWSVDGIAVGNNPNLTYTFEQNGVFTVNLTASSTCLCIAEKEITVEVSDEAGPPIRCTGSVCPGESVSYYTDSGCSNYSWTVSSGGTILSGGGSSDDFVEILWSGGPIGLIELEVNGCSPSLCSRPTIQEIEIIDSSVNIDGSTIVCRDEANKYSIPAFSGTDYTWTITSGAYISSGHNTNVVTVEWNEWSSETEATLSVEYENCLDGCSGSANTVLQVKKRFDIVGEFSLCEDSNPYILAALLPESWYGVEVDWIVTSPSGNVHNETGDQLNYDFSDGPGSYELQAIGTDPSAQCNLEAYKLVQVSESPSAVVSIEGNLVVCPGETNTYTAMGDIVGNVEWTFNDGGSVVSKSGNPISMTWNSSGPYVVKVWQESASPPFCSSEDFEITLPSVNDFEILGPEETCVDQLEEYEIKDVSAFEIDWTIDPPEAGTIINSGDVGGIIVNWHSSGTHDLQAEYCGLQRALQVQVSNVNAPSISGPDKVCIGQTVSLGTVDAYATYSWIDESGTELSSDPNPNFGAGIYVLEVTNAAGCELKTNFLIQEFDEPTVSLTSQEVNWYCPADDPGVEIFASVGADIVSYEWYLDGGLISETNDMTLGTAGTYEVVVTDVNGCVVTSNPLVIFENCDDHGGKCELTSSPGCSDILDAAMTISYGTDCTEILLSNVTPNSTGTFTQWHVVDALNGSADYFSTDLTLQFTEPGFYPIILFTVAVDDAGFDCLAVWYETIEVPAIADFNFFETCAGEAIEFENNSGVANGASISSYEWDFGDPTSSSNSSSDENPQHVYDTPGDYTVTLTIDAGSCEHSVSKQVTVLPPPDIDFTFIDPSCSFSSTSFVPISGSNIIAYDWNFGDTPLPSNSSSAELAFHTFESAGNYDVSLEIIDLYGCTNTVTHGIEIISPGATPSMGLSGSSPICEGESIVLTAPSGGQSYLWSDGSTTESIEVQTSGTYSVLFKDADGCEYTIGPEIIEIIPAPFVYGYIELYDEQGMPIGQVGTEAVICEGETAYLRLPWNSQVTANWDDGHTGNYYNPALNIGTNQFEVYLVDNNTGCESETITFTVEVKSKPAPVVLDAPAMMCEGEENVITITNFDPDFTYVWNTGESSNSIIAYTAGSYRVTCYNQWGCAIKSSSLYVAPAPTTLNVPKGCLEMCLPETLCNIGESNWTYQWFHNGTAIPSPEGIVGDLVIEQEGEYYVEISNYQGCTTSSDPFEVSNEGDGTELTVQAYLDDNGNASFDSGEIELTNIPTTLIHPDGSAEDLLTDQNGHCIFENLLAGSYEVLFDLNGWDPCLPVPLDNNVMVDIVCGDDKYLEVPFESTDSSTPPISIEDAAFTWECGSTALDIDPVVNYAGDLVLTYEWSTGESTTSISIDSPGIYTLSVSNDCETVSKDFEVTNAQDSEAVKPIEVPTAFSPNGDGMNDEFYPIPNLHVEILELDFRVYDRWGNKVYAGTDIGQGWKAVENEVGVFVWIVKGRMENCGEEMDFFEKGNVTLIR